MSPPMPQAVLQEFADKAERFVNHHLPRFVFIHINKTAGSSIERALGLRFEHKTAQEKRRELGEWRWQRAYKFAFVRNPFDKVVSHYTYRVKTNQTGMGDGHIAFKDWVRRAYGEQDPRYCDQPRMFQPQVDWIVDEQGKVIVDFVGHFERLNEDFEKVRERLHTRRALPHAKQSRSDDFRTYYDDETRAIVASVFRRDLDEFGYSAEG